MPALAPTDSCNNITAPYIPANATRRIDLPEYDHDIVGLIPWVDRDCTQAYLAASRRENARAVIFYQPNNHDTNKPPSSDSRLWDLGDNEQWKKDYDFPVYAVPGPSGSRLMHQLSQYSGKSTDNSSANSSPETAYSVRCARLYTLFNFGKPRMFFFVSLFLSFFISSRLTTDLEADAPSSVPGIWVFILAILGALVFVMLSAYVVTQHVQKKRRANLQRRLVAGEIDLEHLGIKRLVVPPHLLSQLPVYVYPENAAESPIDPDSKAVASEKTSQKDNPKSEQDQELKTLEPQKNEQQQQQQQQTYDESISAILEEVTPPPRARNGCRLTFSQLTCAICLDDFVPGSSLVRELPCTHIFHPECVDTFLMRDGSTCPVCKHNVLPSSFISEQVTNFMVRREQRMRRLHSHHDRELELQGLYLSFFERVQARVRGLFERVRRGGRDREESEQRDIQSPSSEQNSQHQQQQPVDPGEEHDLVRRQMMQRRAMALLGTPVNNNGNSSSPQQTETSLSSSFLSSSTSSSSSSGSSLSSSSLAQSSPNLA